MARIGVNPARGKSSDYQPARVTVALLCCIPHLDGYFKHRLDVLKLTLTSLLAHTRSPYDLMVFDNDSCPPVVDYLRSLNQKGALDYLLLSQQNIGKIGALKFIFNAAQGEVVAYADDDIFFYPGWLEAHLEVLQAFPDVGMVSGIPLRDRSKRASQTLKKLQQTGAADITITNERRVPDEWEADWASSVGRDPKEHLAATSEHKEIVLRTDDIEAIGTASHFQFVAPRQVILAALPADWSGRLMGEMIELDEAVDSKGRLRLSTVNRYVRHMGNALSPDMVAAARELGLEVGQAVVPKVSGQHWLLRLPGVRRIVRAVYDRTFHILHQGGRR
ncbi:MAG: glycosyltransferase family 2 protein [Chloroflexi bacterium]|nr:glycosyltransferase family 2 protein [Chloroflexota bacterium]